MNDDGGERPLQRFGRRYGPLLVILVVIVAGGVVVARTDGGIRADDQTAQAPPGTGDRGISFSEARERNLDVTFGPGCDPERGRIAIPSAFSPECYAEAEDNGGATSPGVTADRIKVVVYLPRPNPLTDAIFAAIGVTDTVEQTVETYRGYIEIYNRFYELYGRQVEMVTFDGTTNPGDAVAARSDVARIADEHEPFAVLGGPLLTPAFGEELAAMKIVHFDLASTKAAQRFVDHAPYNWNTLAAPDQSARVVAEYIGKRLAGRPAVHAGDEELKGRTRTFGLAYLATPGSDDQPTIDALEEGLREYGVELAVKVGSLDPTGTQETRIARLKDEGVTSVILISDPLSPRNLTAEATTQNYFPEWVLSGTGLVDSTAFARSYDQRQWRSAFGVSQLFARAQPEANWSYAVYRWYFGTEPPAVTGALVIFPGPTTLFAGIMGAGPRLTPETFRNALFAAPPLGGGLTVPRVSFGERDIWPLPDYNGIDDAVEIWYDADARGPDERGEEGSGMYRYVDGGKRYLPGDWPETDPKVFVDEPAAVAIYQETPEEDRPPDYPPPDRSP